MEVNEIQKKVLSDKIYKYFKGDLRDKKIAIWGLAFKPNTDDIREAPALQIITDLLSEGAIISAYDPEANNHVRAVFGDRIEISDEMYSVLDNADALAIITEWSVFRSPDFEQMMRQMKNPLIFDGRNVFEPEKVREKGFDYFSIGRE